MVVSQNVDIMAHFCIFGSLGDTKLFTLITTQMDEMGELLGDGLRIISLLTNE